MSIKSYLNLYQLQEQDKTTKEERRSFGLSYSGLQNKHIKQLTTWIESRYDTLSHPLLSETFATYLYGLTFVLVILGFLVGFFSGIALLSYNGTSPVNVVYFMAMVIALPLFTMLLSLFSMLKAQQTQSVLVHLSPAYWMEKILLLLPHRFQFDIEGLHINPLLSNWLVIKRSQFIALFFSIGLGLSLLMMVATKDIAFAWSTTLQITPTDFHSFLLMVSTPWSGWLPSAVPSLELIEQSHYFRLGDRLGEEMIKNASSLGEWWKFLVCATLFYAIFLRFLVYLLASFGFHKALEKSMLSMDGVRQLLRDINEPIISTNAEVRTEKQEIDISGHLQIALDMGNTYTIVQGWAMPEMTIKVLNDSLCITASFVYEVGGSNSLKEDSLVISKSKGTVLLYVKAWEPPTMDFIDYLEELVETVAKVIVTPIGTEENHYVTTEKSMKEWERKLATYDNEKIWLQRINAQIIEEK